MHFKHLRKLVFLPLWLCLAVLAFGQGVTTATMSGAVEDAESGAIDGATVKVVHIPSGSVYGALSVQGRYQIPNLRVGGPYTITVSYLGYKDVVKENIYLQLGQNFRQDFKLVAEGVQLNEVVIAGSNDPLLNAKRNGMGSQISNRQVNELPAITRSINDLVRLTPQANLEGNNNNPGISIAGANTRSNNISIDGAVNNDVFNLAGTGGTPGGQTGANNQGLSIISLDAVDQIQVAIAPFDVRQGSFTGGGVNVVTRSGTNDISGSVYLFHKSRPYVGDIQGLTPDLPRTKVNGYVENQYGFRVGGPIIKNKLFYFVNGEFNRRFEPSLASVGTDASRFTSADLQPILDTLQRRYGYDAGGFGDFTVTNRRDNFFGRLDWNINQNHKLTFRHNYVEGFTEGGQRTANSTNFTFNNGNLRFRSITNSTVLELKSTFGARIFNNFLATYTSVRDRRTTMGDPFPRLRIDISGGRSVFAGSEEFSTKNQLDQDILAITNNFSYFAGKHNFTIGTHNEIFWMRNLFIRQAFGSYRFSLANFNGNLAPTNYNYSYSIVPGEPDYAAKFSAGQFSLYFQDEWSATKNLVVTFGIRADLPLMFTTPLDNPNFNNDAYFTSFGVRTNNKPQTNVLWSPRVGFNWDVLGDRSLQVRGGAGVFTGRVPFVYVSNNYGNTGATISSIALSGGSIPAGFRFNPDPNNQVDNADLGRSLPTAEVNVFAPDFKFPQVFRANIAVDKQLPWGIVATAEFLYSRNFNSIYYEDLNLINNFTRLQLPVGATAGDTRLIYNVPLTGAGTNYNRALRNVNSNFTNVMLLRNTDDGYAMNFTFSLQKVAAEGFSFGAAYSYTRAYDVNPLSSDQAASAWRFTPNVNGLNTVGQGIAATNVPHRVTANVLYSAKIGKNFRASAGLFYQGQSGRPFSFLYRNDLSGQDIQGTNNNNLIYIPRDASEIVFTNAATATQQWNDLNDYINKNPYLSSRRGQYAERNASNMPFTHRFDLRLTGDIIVRVNGKPHDLQLTLDIVNIGNWLDRNAGKQYFIDNLAATPLQFDGFVAGTRIPTFTYFRPNSENLPWNIDQFRSNWQMQLGIRYSFN